MVLSDGDPPAHGSAGCVIYYRPRDLFLLIFSQRAILACLGAFHPCPHATVTWSPWVGGTRQYFVYILIPKYFIAVYMTLGRNYDRFQMSPKACVKSVILGTTIQTCALVYKNVTLPSRDGILENQYISFFLGNQISVSVKRWDPYLHRCLCTFNRWNRYIRYRLKQECPISITNNRYAIPTTIPKM